MHAHIQVRNALSYRWAIGAAVTLAFAGAARALRGVTNSGALAGCVVCFLLYLGGGPGAFAALIAVFVLAWISTRVGYRRKLELGTAERKEGRRASQVFANLSVAALCTVAHIFYGGEAWLLASVAALAEAAADTVSSEIGQAASTTAYLITNLAPVEAGTDGAVTLQGSFAGFAAAILVTATAAFSGMVPHASIGLPVLAAFVGMLADSLFGACFERRRILNNDGVNFLGTLVAAAITWLCYVTIRS